MRAALCLLLLAGADQFAAGLRAYREGRYQDALSAFRAAEQEAGPGAAAELLYNKALAALQAGEVGEAAAAAQRAAERGGPEIAPLCDFLLGNVAFARCATAAAQAGQVEAEPFAWDAAILQAEKAKQAWQQAALSRPDWPEARRNVERALLKLEELKKSRDEARQRQESQREPEQRFNPVPLPQEQGEKSEEEAKIEAQLVALSPEQVQALLVKLEEKEREKRGLRRAQQQARKEKAEKDW